MHYASFRPATSEVEQGLQWMIKSSAGPKGQHTRAADEMKTHRGKWGVILGYFYSQ